MKKMEDLDASKVSQQNDVSTKLTKETAGTFSNFIYQNLNNHYVKSGCVRSYSGQYFRAFGQNTERYFIFLRIQSECRKIRTRITPNTDNFYAVNMTDICILPSSLALEDMTLVFKKCPKSSKENYRHASIFFYQAFASQLLKIQRAAGKGRGPCFIPICHFHPLTNIETFICNFACEMTDTYFQSHCF